MYVMLKLNDLSKLSSEVLEAKVSEVSAILVPKIVDRGIVKANGNMEFKSNSLNCLDISISVLKGAYLSCSCEGVSNTEYVISVSENGFNTVSILDDGTVICNEYNVESISENSIVYNGDSVMLSDITA